MVEVEKIRSAKAPEKKIAELKALELSEMAARNRRMAQRIALVRELLSIAMGAVVLALLFFGIRKYGQYQAEQEQARLQLIEQEKAEEAKRQRAAEQTARDLQEARRKADEARREQERRQAETARLQREEQQKLLAHADRYHRALAYFKQGVVDRWNNAVDSERPDRVSEETGFLCLFSEGLKGLKLYDVVVAPGRPLTVYEWLEQRLPEKVDADVFAALLKKKPYLIMRNYLTSEALSRGQPPRVIFHSPTVHLKRVMAPAPGTTFNPSALEFGEIYETMKVLGVKKLAYQYEVKVHLPGLAVEESVGNAQFNGEIASHAFERCIRSALETQSRNMASKVNRYKVTDEMVADMLKKSEVSVKIVR